MSRPDSRCQAIVITGPTASGKTSLAIEIAERLQTEIISADSMQIYRGMAIGTAAPSAAELDRVRHHFIGIVNPDAYFSAGEFQRQARSVVSALNDAGKTAVVAGGSGLYVRALVDGLHSGPGKDDETRARLKAEAAKDGVERLFQRLQQVDPDYATAILPNDLRRIVRALEVYALTGQAFSSFHHEHQASLSPLDALWIGIDVPRDQLYARIDRRVDAMVEMGFEHEVRRLVDAGYESHLERIKTLGYREFLAYFRGEQSRDDAIANMKLNTRRFAKRQLSWFRPEKRIQWLCGGDDVSVASIANQVIAMAGAKK